MFEFFSDYHLVGQSSEYTLSLQSPTSLLLGSECLLQSRFMKHATSSPGDVAGEASCPEFINSGRPGTGAYLFFCWATPVA